MGSWKLRYNPLFLFFIVFLTSCSEVTTNTNQNTSTVGSENSGTTQSTQKYAVVLGSNFTDPIGTLGVIPIDAPRTPMKNIQTTHSDAVVQAFGKLLYVVNRLGGDNIQVVDPSLNFKVTRQFSVGRGTNPQEIIVTEPTKGYVTLYQPEDNRSADLTVDDLLIVNPETGKILKTIDLTPFTGDDGERFARASAMLLVGDKIFVEVQDMPKDLSRRADQPGKLVAIDTKTDRITGSIVLQGRDPVAMNYAPETGLLYIADADYFDTSSPYGGIERVEPNTLKTEGIVIDDLLLGGAPGALETDPSKGFVMVGFFNNEIGNFSTKVVSFDLGREEVSPLSEIYRSRAFIQDIALDENGILLVGDRDPKVNGILFIDPSTSRVIDGPINLGSAPSSITFAEY